MKSDIIEIYDKQKNIILTATIENQIDNRIYTRITHDLRPPEIKNLFDSFAETAEDQIFSILDEIADKIEKLELSLGSNFQEITDVQIFESNLTFRIK